MSARVITPAKRSERRQNRAGRARERHDKALLHRQLARCPNCQGSARTPGPCDDSELSEEGRAAHAEVLAEGTDHIHMTCSGCGHVGFVSLEK